MKARGLGPVADIGTSRKFPRTSRRAPAMKRQQTVLIISAALAQRHAVARLACPRFRVDWQLDDTSLTNGLR
jgi:hypothetical protein